MNPFYGDKVRREGKIIREKILEKNLKRTFRIFLRGPKKFGHIPANGGIPFPYLPKEYYFK